MVKKVKFGKNDDGVSESMAYILLAAIVLVLSMIVAAYSFGLVQTVKSPDLVVITVTRLGADRIEITNFGGDGVSMLTSSEPFQVNIDGTSAVPISGALTATAGSSAVYAVNPNSHVVVVGSFAGDSKRVIYDKTF
jgi:FlaG/FlaF family flagellin (archaellin)